MSLNIFNLFILGLSFGCGPCIASCGPMLVSYIAGTKKGILAGFWVYFLFSLTRILVYLILSLVIFLSGRFILKNWFGNYSKYAFMAAGGFIIFVGLLMILGKSFAFKPLEFLHKRIIEQGKLSVIGLGLVIGLLPCAPLLALFSYTGLTAKTAFESLLYAFFFGLGTFISPLIFLAMASGWIARFLKGNRAYSSLFVPVCGAIMIFLGAQLIMGVF